MVNLQKARETVDQITRVAQEELTDVPKIAPVQRKLLEEELRFYKELSAQAGDDPTMRYEIARAHRRLANGARDLGRVEQAETHFREAVALLEKLVADFPATRSYQQELAVANLNLGSFLHDDVTRKSLATSKESEACVRRAIAIGEKLAAADQTDASC